MTCKFCIEGYYPAVNINGVVVHQTPPTIIVAHIEGERIVPCEWVYKNGIEICTR